jgi:hypothetical protein
MDAKYTSGLKTSLGSFRGWNPTLRAARTTLVEAFMHLVSVVSNPTMIKRR